MDIFQMSLSASVLIVAVVIIRSLTLHKLPKKTFLVLWGVVVCRLLVPFSIPSRFSFYTGIDMVRRMLTEKTAASSPEGIPGISNMANMPGTGEPIGVSASTVFISPIEIVWLAGMCACALFFIVAYIKYYREFKMSLPIENDFITCWLREHPMRRPVQIQQSDKIKAPLTYGVFCPVILLPMKTDWTDEVRLRVILTHEFVHIRRFDTLTKLLLTAVVCVHWFNPFVWVMYVLANRDIELSCDEAVVRTFGETIKSAYALTLIGLEEKKSRLTPLVNNFSKNAIEERIVSIMKMKKISIITFVVATIIVVGATVGFATTAKRDIGNSDAVSSTEPPTPTAVAASSSSVPSSSTEKLAKIEADAPSAKPVAEKALPEYWKMGALNVNGVPYLPLVATAKNLGYTVNVVSKNIDNPKYPNTVEYNYELVKDGKSLGIASLDISDGKVVTSMIDGIFCNTHDQATHTSIVLQKDAVYMPAQFFKEALDTGNKLP